MKGAVPITVHSLRRELRMRMLYDAMHVVVKRVKNVN